MNHGVYEWSCLFMQNQVMLFKALLSFLQRLVLLSQLFPAPLG